MSFLNREPAWRRNEQQRARRQQQDQAEHRRQLAGLPPRPPERDGQLAAWGRMVTGGTFSGLTDFGTMNSLSTASTITFNPTTWYREGVGYTMGLDYGHTNDRVSWGVTPHIAVVGSSDDRATERMAAPPPERVPTLREAWAD